MNDILWQILLFGAAGLVVAIVLPARSRLRGRNYNPMAQPDTSTSSEPVYSAGDGGVAEVNPQEKFISDCLRRGRRPTPLEVLPLIKKLERENWPVPTVQDVLEDFDQRRAAIAQRKTQGSMSNQGSAIENEVQAGAATVITRNGLPLGATASTAPVKLSEMKANTIRALMALPKQLSAVPYADLETLSIPLLSDGNNWYFLKLVAGSHWGFFGVTRSGKGNALQHVALNALAFGPEQVMLIVLDAKGGLDYGFCDKIQHAALYADRDIMDGANTALDEMDRRKALLKASDCRNHYEYERKTGIRLPLVIIIADEIAEFNDEQHNRIATLARTSGAMGGILMVATQYPVAKVLPTQIQANVGSRLVFRLASSDQIQVAMRRTKEDEGTYNPALITEAMKGVGVLRLPGGEEALGRVPEVSDAIREEMINALVSEWPKAGGSGELVPDNLRQFERGTSGNREPVPEFEAEPVAEPGEKRGSGGKEEKAIRDLAKSGWSRNEIANFLGGRKQDRLDQIRRALEGDAV